MSSETAPSAELDRAKILDWVGHWVMLKYITGPSLSGEDIDEVAEGPAKIRTALFFLEEVNQFGIMVRRAPQTDHEDYGAFIPWGSVMVLVGPQGEQQESEPTTEEEKLEKNTGEQS